MVGSDGSSLSHLSLVMVQTSEDRNGNHPGSFVLSGTRRSRAFGNLLLNALMGSGLVEVGHIVIEDALKLPLMKDQQMVEAFLPYAPQETFTKEGRDHAQSPED